MCLPNLDEPWACLQKLHFRANIFARIPRKRVIWWVEGLPGLSFPSSFSFSPSSSSYFSDFSYPSHLIPFVPSLTFQTLSNLYSLHPRPRVPLSLAYYTFLSFYPSFFFFVPSCISLRPFPWLFMTSTSPTHCIFLLLSPFVLLYLAGNVLQTLVSSLLFVLFP